MKPDSRSGAENGAPRSHRRDPKERSGFFGASRKFRLGRLFPGEDVREAHEGRVHETADPVEDSQDALSASLDRYEAGLVGLELHMRIAGPGVGRECQYLVARFWCASGEVVGGDAGGGVGNLLTFPADTKAKRVEHLNCRVDVPVLVYVREPVEHGERVPGIRRIPSWVGLEFSHEGGRYRPDQSSMISRVPGASWLEDGELDTLRLLLGRLPPEVQARKLPPAVVQCGSKVVQGIADDDAPSFRTSGFTIDPEVERPRVLIEVFPEGDRIGLSLPCIADIGSQSLDVQIGSTQLRSGVVEGLPGHAASSIEPDFTSADDS
jgi:hypothetical protein